MKAILEISTCTHTLPAAEVHDEFRQIMPHLVRIMANHTDGRLGNLTLFLKKEGSVYRTVRIHALHMLFLSCIH